MIWVALVSAAVGAGWLLGHGDAGANARRAAESAPLCALIVMQGVTVGLCGRDRVRLGRAYASPTLAYLGKALGFGSLAAAGAYALSPVAWDPSTFPLCAAGAAAGVAVWLSSLPVRL
jgi:hypothetical protein